jgi:hypothetical protein
MTEAEWLACDNPEVLFELIRGRASCRKLRLFAAECFGRLARVLPDPRQRSAIEVLVARAEGTTTQSDIGEAGRNARHAFHEFPSRIGVQDPPAGDDLHFVGLMLYREFASSSPGVHALAAPSGLVDGLMEQVRQSELLRDIFGNPFRPVAFSPECRTDTAVALARQMYDSRDFSAMPILADALQDAGCDNADLLGHCRGPGPHVRGCWAVDLVLAKE